MIRSVKELRHVMIKATDGGIGFVEQVFFDDEKWTIRYLVVDTGEEFAHRRVLVSPMAVISQHGEPPVSIDVRLNRRQVANGPDIDTEKPVSRQKELELSRFFLLPPYWGSSGIWGSQMLPEGLLSLSQPIPADHQEAADVHLRSSREVTGYRVQGKDGKIGHVEDFLYDEKNWCIRYIEVDTRLWIFGHHFLVPPELVQAVEWDERTIFVDLPVDAVRSAPTYSSLASLTPEFEARLRAYYDNAWR